MHLEDSETEVSVGSFHADIICSQEDADSKVLVENQLEPTDHRHLGQLITYASGTSDIDTVVWISPKFREEHRAAVDWLNSVTENQVSFFGIEIECWQIDNSRPAVHFHVVASPNEWSRTARGVTSAGDRPAFAKRKLFWASFLKAVDDVGGKVKGNRTPSRYSHMDFRLGSSGIHLAVMCKKSRSVIHVCIKSEIQKRFDFLHARKEPIEERLGFALKWDEPAGEGACYLRSQWDGSCGWGDDSLWEQQHRFMAQRLNTMYGVFAPLVQEM